jgi:peroxiredoxin
MFRNCLAVMVAISFLYFPVSAANAQLGPKDGADLAPTDLERVKVGDKAPDFTLENMDGRPITLSEVYRDKAVVLVFYRGQWWPYCTQQLGELKSLLTPEEKNRVQILAVSVDSHDDSKKFVQKLKERFTGDLDFPLLEDKDRKVINRYGIFNPNSKGWPHPATYVLDKKGVVRWRFIETDYKKRPTNTQILEALRKIP